MELAQVFRAGGGQVVVAGQLRLGRLTEARLAYDEALLPAGNTTERDYLTARRADLDA